MIWLTSRRAIAQTAIADTLRMPDAALTSADIEKRIRGEMDTTYRGSGARFVIIYIDDTLAGCGTYMINDSSIFAAGHCFKILDGKPHVYSFEIFQPHEVVRKYIKSVHMMTTTVRTSQNTQEVWNGDVVKCTVSAKKCKIRGIYPNDYDMHHGYESTLLKTRKEGEYLYDILSAKFVKIMLKVKYKTPENSGYMYYVDLRAYQGRSGSGFLSTTGDFYVLCGEAIYRSKGPTSQKGIYNLDLNTVYGIVFPLNVKHPE